MALSQLKDLRVPARTSSFALKGKKRTSGGHRAVAQRGDGAGRQRGKSGNRLPAWTAQLVKVAADGFHLWSERSPRDEGRV